MINLFGNTAYSVRNMAGALNFRKENLNKKIIFHIWGRVLAGRKSLEAKKWT